ncbi:MAG: hypothetical protein NTY64_19765 [Deltaproteobacteria bacterium]|nr:hypothetical protein [Deltaproteobacteria bacterium]
MAYPKKTTRLDVDVGIPPHRHPAAEEGDASQKIAGNFFGPGERAVQDVAGEELGEDHNGQNPKENEGHPILGSILREVHLGIVRHPKGWLTGMGAGIAIVGHRGGPSSPFSCKEAAQPAPAEPARGRAAPSPIDLYFSACKRS